MNAMMLDSLDYLHEHWHTGISGTSDAASLLRTNPNTFKTRIKRGQALVMRTPDGTANQTPLTFTGYHLIYNLIADRLLRYGIPVDLKENTLAKLPHVYAEWTYENVLCAPYRIDAVLRFWKQEDGRVVDHAFEDGQVENWTGDGCVIIPIGTMTIRLAAHLYMHSDRDAIINKIIAESEK